jgi:4-hydroxymandelate oxidase
MSPHPIHLVSRRRLLQFLAASPLFTQPALAEALRPSDPADWAPRDLDKLITDPKQALDVFDFEPVMKQNVPPAHFGYMATGVDDEVTLRANREGFRKFALRPRRLVDVSNIDMSTEILGAKYDSPIVIAPTGSNRAFHPDAEIAVAKAAKAGNHLQILSTVATTSIEDAIAARGAPVWFQLYTTQRWEVAEGLVKRAVTAGAPAIVVTLDVRTPAKWETFVRLRRTDTREPRRQRLSIAKTEFCRHRSRRRQQYDRHQPQLGFDQTFARHGQGQARAQRHSRLRGRQARG